MTKVSELAKLFLPSLCLLDLEHIEADCLAERSTLTDYHKITNLYISVGEGGGMSVQVKVWCITATLALSPSL